MESTCYDIINRSTIFEEIQNPPFKVEHEAIFEKIKIEKSIGLDEPCFGMFDNCHVL